jgi:hypothetical protein
MRSSGIARLGLSAVIVIAALFGVAFLSRPKNTAGPCEVTNRASVTDVPEASGLAVSRRHPGLLWTHNDSGHEPILFAVDPSGTVHGRVRVPILTRDWESLAAASCPRVGADQTAARTCLYIGDIGDNEMSRRTIQVYRVAEPEPAGQSGRPEAMSLTYPDGPHNAEAMFIADDRIFIVTKDRSGMLYRSAAAVDDVLSVFSQERTNIRLQRIASLGLVGVTDAGTSPDGATVAVRTSGEVVIYATVDLIRGNVAARVRIPVNAIGEPQGEGLALGQGGMLYLASEGRPWNRAGRLITLGCATRLL